MRFRTILLAATSFVCASSLALAADKVAHHKAPVRKAPVHKASAHKAMGKHRVAARGAGGVSLAMDEVRVVTFPGAVSTVFVGNPTIADATVIDPHHAFILGKTFGVTNMIALNAQNQTIVNQQISVANRSGGMVTLNKGTNQFSYSCTKGHCESNPVPGDQKTFVEDTSATVASHQDQALKAASATASTH